MPRPEKIETLYAGNRDEWRRWLAKNHRKKKSVWLIYYKKHTAKPTIPYDDAVSEAICFGWIDTTVRRLDDERYMQKYTPRNRASIWSQLNIQRARRMIAEGRMTKAGLDLFRELGKRASRAVPIPKTYRVPRSLARALARVPVALRNWRGFAPSHKKMYVYWILDAKKPETRARRIQKVVERAAKNIKVFMA